MKALIVKKIDIETRELPEDKPYYYEAVRPDISVMIKQGENTPVDLNCTQIAYERMRLINPETNESSNYFVNVDDRKLWNELVSVSDGFINSKIEQGVQRFRDQFITWDLPKIEQRQYKKGWSDFKKLPWYKRLFTNLIN